MILPMNYQCFKYNFITNNKAIKIIKPNKII